MANSGMPENKLGTMPINKLLITTSLPMIISMLVQALYNVVDSMFVSRIEEDALTAVSLAFSLQNLMISIAVGTGVGVGALVSKSLGEKNFENANRAANNAFVLYMITYAVFLLGAFTITRPFFEIQTDDATIIQYGVDYMRTILICSFGMLLQILLERLLISTGRSFYSMICQATGAVINMIMDPILIFGYFGAPALGVKGAAVATVFGQIVAACLGLTFNIKINKDIVLSPKYMPLKAEIVKRIYSVGVPSILMAAIGSVMTFAMNKILIVFSTTAVAVFGVYFKLQSFVFMPVFGLNNGMVPIVAYNYGARNRDRIMKTIKLAMAYAVAIMLIGFVVFETIPGTLLKIFAASDEMLKIGIPAMRLIAIPFIVAGANIIMGSSFQALDNAVYSLIVSVARQLVVLVPAAYLLSFTGNLNMVWLAFPIAEIMSSAASIFFFRRQLKTKLNF